MLKDIQIRYVGSGYITGNYFQDTLYAVIAKLASACSSLVTHECS